MIWQMHHERWPMGGDGEFVAQTEVDDGIDGQVAIGEWLKTLKKAGLVLPPGRM